MAPLILFLVPDGNLNLGCVFTHVNSVWENELNLNTNVCSYVCRGIWIGDVSKTLFNSQNWSHGPLGSHFTLLMILIHLEVDDTTHHKVVLDLVWRQVIIAGPESSDHDLTTGLLLRQLSDMVVEDNIVAVLVLAGNVGPDAKENISFTTHGVQ